MSDSSQSPTAAARGHAAPGRLAVLYDGHCQLCRVSAEAVRVYDNSDAIDLVDIHEEEKRAQFPGLTMERLLEELHVVDDRGRVLRGARAVNEILRYQHGVTGMLAWLWYMPGYAWLADRQYKRIASSRYRRDARGRLMKPDRASNG